MIKRVSNRNLNQYFKEIGAIALLSKNEERQHARKARLGDEDSRERIIVSNLRFVVSVAKKYLRRGLSLPDLVNAGNCGLIEAAGRYDERKKVRFLTYAIWWIRKAIYDAISEEHGLISTGTLDKKLDRVINKLYHRLGREPAIEEIAREIGVSPEEVNLARQQPLTYISLDQTADEDEKTPWLELVDALTIPSPEDLYHRKELQAMIKRHLDILERLEREIVERSFGLGDRKIESIEMISKSMNLTRERVRLVREQALRKLRSVIYKDYIEEES